MNKFVSPGRLQLLVPKCVSVITMLVVTSWLSLAGCDAGPDEQSMNNLLSSYPAGSSETPLSSPGTMPANSLAPAASQPALPASAGVDDYVRLAVEQNPGIRRARFKVLRLASRIPQVTSLDDPVASVTPIGAMSESAAGEVTLMNSISQTLPFPGKLSAKGRIAAQEVAAATEELVETRLGVIADVRRAYWSYYFAVMAIDLTQRNRQVLEQFREVATAKLRAGTASQQDVLRITVELSSLDNQLLDWNQKKIAAVSLLNSLMDRPVKASLAAPKPVELQSFSMLLDHLLDQAGQSNPQLAKVKSQIKAERDRLQLAKLQRLPDLTVSFDYNFVSAEGVSPVADGKDQWWVGFSFNIPIWFQKLAAAEREAQNGILENSAELADLRNRIGFRVQDSLSRIESQQRQTQIFRDMIIPQSQQTLDVSLSDYKAGKTEFITLVDNWRKVLEFQLLYHQSLSQLEQNFADLQQVIGHDLARPNPTTAPADAPSGQ